MKKNIVSISLIIIFIVLAGCFNNDNENNDISDKSTFSIYYWLFVFINDYDRNNSEFEIIIPIILLKNDSISILNNYLSINNKNGYEEIIKTKYGIGVKIISNISFKEYTYIEENKRYFKSNSGFFNNPVIDEDIEELDIPDINNDKYFQDPMVKISLEDSNRFNENEINDHYFWVYFNSSSNLNISIFLKFEINNGDNILTFRLDNYPSKMKSSDVILKKGWNSYYVQYGTGDISGIK
jgi:hypothetical protein